MWRFAACFSGKAGGGAGQERFIQPAAAKCGQGGQAGLPKVQLIRRVICQERKKRKKKRGQSNSALALVTSACEPVRFLARLG